MPSDTNNSQYCLGSFELGIIRKKLLAKAILFLMPYNILSVLPCFSNSEMFVWGYWRGFPNVTERVSAYLDSSSKRDLGMLLERLNRDMLLPLLLVFYVVN